MSRAEDYLNNKRYIFDTKRQFKKCPIGRVIFIEDALFAVKLAQEDALKRHSENALEIANDYGEQVEARVQLDTAKEIFEELENNPIFKKEYSYLFNVQKTYLKMKKRFLSLKESGKE